MFVFAFIGTMNINAKSDNNLVYNYEQKRYDGSTKPCIKKKEAVYRTTLSTITSTTTRKEWLKAETVKWNNIKNRWDNDMCIRYTYEGKTVTTEYYKWNGKKHNMF